MSATENDTRKKKRKKHRKFIKHRDYSAEVFSTPEPHSSKRRRDHSKGKKDHKKTKEQKPAIPKVDVDSEDSEIQIVEDSPNDTDELVTAVNDYSNESYICESDCSHDETNDNIEIPEEMNSAEMKTLLNKILTREFLTEPTEEERHILKDLNIVINWNLSPVHQLKSLQCVSDKEEEELRQNGIELLLGVWSKEEMSILVRNWRKFSKEYGIKSPLELIGARNEVKLKRNQKTLFAMYLGQGLDRRPLISIYKQAQRILHPYKYKGRLKKREVRTLKRLLLVHGRRWEKIGMEMGRCGVDLFHYWKFHTDTKNGKWSSKESKRLTKALTKVMGTTDITTIHTAIPWQEVAKVVKTRNGSQCRKRWLYNLAYKLRGQVVHKWSMKNNTRLIKKLSECPWQTESEVPWDDFCEELGCRNPYEVMENWRKLRMRVPQYYIKPFPEITDWLVHNYLPKLEERINKTSN